MNKEELEKIIIRHKSLYYAGMPEVSDIEYDKLEEKLKKIAPNSKVLDLIGTRTSRRNKVPHQKKMLSLMKTYDFDELMRWMDLEELVSIQKVDGSSCSIIYKQGKLSMAKTRGDGEFGEDITDTMRWVLDIPALLKQKIDLEIRGEIFCNEKNFFDLSKEMKKIGLEMPSSKRNIVAGLINRKDYIHLNQYLSFFAFDLLGEDFSFEKEIEKLNYLKELGFKVPPFTFCRNKESVQREISLTKNFMEEGEYLIDGLVLCFNELSKVDLLGETNHHPKYKMAFKFQGEVKKTIVEKIIWSVSRNGILTPVAEVSPTELSGAMITKVSLHNYGVIKTYSLVVGDEIEIVRSGEVIPKFLRITKKSKKLPTFPQECPSCHVKVIIQDIRILCPNSLCESKILQGINYFVKKIGVYDLSEKRLEELIRVGLVKKIPDLYRLDKEDFLKLDKVKETLALKLYENIQITKKVHLVKFLTALGITGASSGQCEKIVLEGFDTLKRLKSLRVSTLREVSGFAELSAQAFYDSFREKWPLIEELLEVGFEIKAVNKKEGASSRLKGKAFCLTGALERKRKDVIDDIKNLGGLVLSSVTSKTHYLVTNDKGSGSSKLEKAKKFGTQVISEEELYNLMNEK